MTLIRIGSEGDQVRQLQARLQELGFYRGPEDGIFGGGTEGAVKAFQGANGLVKDGKVGDATWAKLLRQVAAPSANPLLAAPVEKRCLALTGSFETGRAFPECFVGVSGDFDGQGLSLGVLQWNFGQGSLQPLLQEALEKLRGPLADIFHERLPVLEAALSASREEQLTFARSIQDPRDQVLEPWRGMFKSLCRLPEFQDIQARHAARTMDRARSLAHAFELRSTRGLALMFDIVTQNGSIGPVVAARIRQDYAALPPELDNSGREVEKMRSVALRRSAAANPRWADDVRIRKLCIAEGHGRVHGIDYDLEAQFGLTA